MRRLHVVGARRRERVGEREALLAARVVHRQLLALHVEREALGTPAEARGRALDALAEQLAEALAPADPVDHLLDRRGVAPDELEAARVLRREDAVLVALHRERDGGARRDRVEHVLRVELVDPGERVQVVDAAERAGGRERLVLGPAVLALHALRRDLDLALARHRARVAGAAVHEDRPGHLLAADVARALEGAVAEVAGGQDATRLERQHGARRAELVEAVLRAVVVLAEPHERALGAVLVHRDRRLRAAHDDRLEVLGAHDRAQAAAAVEVLELVHERGEADAPLAGDARLEHAHALVAQLPLDALLDLARERAPVRGGVAELDAVVPDPEVDGRGGAAAHGDPVPARGAQLGAPPAAGLALAVAAGQRRLRRGRVTVRAREREPVDDARHQHQDVVGAERVHARRHVAQQQVRGERAPAQVLAHHGLRELLRPRLPGGEIDVQDLRGDARCHGGLLGVGAPHPNPRSSRTVVAPRRRARARRARRGAACRGA